MCAIKWLKHLSLFHLNTHWLSRNSQSVPCSCVHRWLGASGAKCPATTNCLLLDGQQSHGSQVGAFNRNIKSEQVQMYSLAMGHFSEGRRGMRHQGLVCSRSSGSLVPLMATSPKHTSLSFPDFGSITLRYWKSPEQMMCGENPSLLSSHMTHPSS